MSIRAHIGIVIGVTALGGLLLASMLRGQFRALDSASAGLRVNAMTEGDLRRLTDGIQHFMLTADLVLSGENSYLVETVDEQGSAVQALVTRLQGSQLAEGSEAPLGRMAKSVEALKQTAQEVAFANGPEREEVLNRGFLAFDSESVLLIEDLESIARDFSVRSLAATEGVERSRAALDVTVRSYGTFYLLIVLLVFWWTSARLITPLVRLSLAARVAGAEDRRLELEEKGPREIREVTRSIQALVQDLEESRRGLEVKVLHRTKALEEALHVKSDFLASMSHELRTPMNGVIGMTDVLSESTLDSSQKELVDIIQSSGTALLRIIDDILDFSRLEKVGVELESLPMNLHIVATQTIELLSNQMRPGVGLTLDTGVCPDQWVKGDAGRLRQVLINLLGNAAKFTESGAVRLELAVTNKPEGCVQVLFAVHDTGIGIGQAAVKGLFKPFSQADTSTTRRFGGSGLGLSISQSLVALMGGEIRVESTLGEGSTFSFCLELEPVKSAPQQADPPPALPTENEATRDINLLVVEDDRINRRVVQKMLGKLGYSPTFAVNGLEAVVMAAELKPDIILMDCHMPEMDGLEATRQIRQIPDYGEHVIILALTANVGVGVEQQVLAAGMDAYLTKPMKLSVLGRALGDWSHKIPTEG